MKKLILILCLLPVLSITSCEDDDNNCQGIDCLPPATQTGAGTFGCLVNGEPFVDNSGFFNSFYQLVNGEFNFSISAEDISSTPRNIRLSTNNIELEQGNMYQLIEPLDGNAHAKVIFSFEGVQPNENSTNEQYSGTLMVTKFDIENNIVSGIFNFQIRDTINNIDYNINDGRFDAQFTQ